ncbi:hypothetical protein Tco_0251796 [Tanacetum coccineum]
MANIRTCNKHNMIACVEKTAQNADFYQIIDSPHGCSINYSFVGLNPDLIGPLSFNNFGATASPPIDHMMLPPHSRPRDIGYEGNLAHLHLLAKPQFRPQGSLATNQKFNFSLMILTGMLGHISNGTPFLMYPREVKRLKRQTLSQAKQIIKLKAKLKKLSKFVAPVVKHHAFWVENQNLKKQKRRRKKHKKKVSSVKLGRNKDEGTLSEEHNVQEEDTTHPFFDDIVDKDAAVTPLIWKETTLNFEDEAGPSSPLRPIQIVESEEHLKAAEVLKKTTLQQIRALETNKDEELLEKSKLNGMQEEEMRRGLKIEENKAKDYFKEPTSLAFKKEINDGVFLKRERNGEVEGKSWQKDSQGKGKLQLLKNSSIKES